MSRPQGFTPATRRLVDERSGGLCERCGNWGQDMQYHHRRARGMGSTKRPESNLPANCLHLDSACHAAIESARAEAYEYGWLVRQHETPEDIPVLRRGVWCLLDNGGGYLRCAAPGVQGEAS